MIREFSFISLFSYCVPVNCGATVEEEAYEEVEEKAPKDETEIQVVVLFNGSAFVFFIFRWF